MDIRLNQLICLACFGGMLVIGVLKARSAWQGAAALTASTRAALAGLFLAAVAVRWLLPPSFLHSNLHGYGLLEGILSFPEPSRYRGEAYGQGSFAVLGLVTKVLGGAWHTVVLTNGVVNAGILLCAAVLAYRLRGELAALACLATGVCWPVFAKTGASEDAHNVACFFGLLAFVFVDNIIRERRFKPLDALAVVLSSCLAILSRESLFYWPFLIGLLFLLARPWRWMGKYQLAYLALAVLTISLASGAVLFQLFALKASMASASLMFHGFTPDRIIFLAGYHTFFRDTESLALSFVIAVGALSVVRRLDPTGMVLVLGAGAAFASSLGGSVTPSFLDEYGFILPLAAFSAPLLGVGADVIGGSLASSWFRTQDSELVARLAATAVLGTVVLASIVSLWRVADKQDVMAQEYEIIERHAAQLPSGATVMVPLFDCGGGYRKSCYQTLPRAAFASAKSSARLVPLDEDGRAPHGAASPVYMLQNIACFSYGGNELIQATGADGWKLLTDADSNRFESIVRAFWSWPQGSEVMREGPLPSGIRPECAAAFSGATVFQKWGEVEVYRHDMPMLFFSTMRMPIGVWQVDAGSAEAK